MGTAAAMLSLLDTHLNFLVYQGLLYLPLLFDSEILEESHVLVSQGVIPEESPTGVNRVPAPAVLASQDRLFVQAVRASSLVDNYARLFPKEHEDRRRTLREQYSLTADLFGVALDPTLVAIVFHILPHFLRRQGLLKRRRLKEGEILDLIRERVEVPHYFTQQARNFLDLQPLKEALHRLETATCEPEPLPEGLVPAARVRAWWEEALAARLLAEERASLMKGLEDREYWAAAQEGRLAVLLYVAEKGSLELDGFGFTRLKGSQDYRIYKRTGPFALQDFYGRLYLFPDCRVAVHTFGRLRPVVVDHYKHPFLRRHGSGQPICVGPESQDLTFSAQNAIQVLEEGIHTLLYSYDRRRRRGYHRLDHLPGMMRFVDFEDYRIPKDHPLIVSGQVEVKNWAT
jgi:hypothetical protein